VGSGIWFAVVRRGQSARLGVLVLIPIAEALRRPDRPAAIAAATILSLLIAFIYQQVPDDLALSPESPTRRSRKMFQLLRGRDVIASLADKPQVPQMGHKAATLAQLQQAGYPVPPGWILPMGSTARSLIRHLEKVVPDAWQQPWIVRSSALDEDQEAVSAAGQYLSVGNVTSPAAMEQAIADCRAAYYRESAQQYRRDRGLPEQPGLALLVQRQVQGVYAGVAFSRDPVDQGQVAVVEALRGQTDQVVSGQVTPESYRLTLEDDALAEVPPPQLAHLDSAIPAQHPEGVPQAVVQRAAALARHLELYYHGIPQDIEWCYDGTQLWLLQSRPITTLTPIWTRKIAAEVIPGVIRPLTWSINRPLTCGVWGNIFTIVLGPRAHGLDFGATATLHYARAYFNATLLGQIFRRMGLPPESFAFLTLLTAGLFHDGMLFALADLTRKTE
jgi:pyruvate,water dikinase